MKRTVILILCPFLLFTKFKVVNANEKVFSAHGSISILSKQLELFKRYTGRYPATKEGLAVLTKPSKKTSNWKGLYIKSSGLAKDPWGRSYVYFSPARYGTKAYDLYSLGKNGKNDYGAKDDISNWKDIDFRYYKEAIPHNATIPDRIQRVELLYRKPYLIVYGTEKCGWVIKYVNKLKKKGIKYMFKSLSKKDVKNELYPRMKKAGHSLEKIRYPIIDVNGMIFIRPSFNAIDREYRK